MSSYHKGMYEVFRKMYGPPDAIILKTPVDGLEVEQVYPITGLYFGVEKDGKQYFIPTHFTMPDLRKPGTGARVSTRVEDSDGEPNEQIHNVVPELRITDPSSETGR